MSRYKKSQLISINPTVLLQVLLVFLVVGGFVVYEKFMAKKSPQTGNSSGSATLLIEFSDKKRMFEGDIYEGMTVLDALNASMVAGNIEFKYTVDSKNNTSVVKIDGHNDRQSEFSFYINNRNFNQKELNKITISPQDQIVVKIK